MKNSSKVNLVKIASVGLSASMILTPATAFAMEEPNAGSVPEEVKTESIEKPEEVNEKVSEAETSQEGSEAIASDKTDEVQEVKAELEVLTGEPKADVAVDTVSATNENNVSASEDKQRKTTGTYYVPTNDETPVTTSFSADQLEAKIEAGTVVEYEGDYYYETQNEKEDVQADNEKVSYEVSEGQLVKTVTGDVTTTHTYILSSSGGIKNGIPADSEEEAKTKEIEALKKYNHIVLEDGEILNEDEIEGHYAYRATVDASQTYSTVFETKIDLKDKTYDGIVDADWIESTVKADLETKLGAYNNEDMTTETAISVNVSVREGFEWRDEEKAVAAVEGGYYNDKGKKVSGKDAYDVSRIYVKNKKGSWEAVKNVPSDLTSGQYYVIDAGKKYDPKKDNGNHNGWFTQITSETSIPLKAGVTYKEPVEGKAAVEAGWYNTETNEKVDESAAKITTVAAGSVKVTYSTAQATKKVVDAVSKGDGSATYWEDKEKAFAAAQKDATNQLEKEIKAADIENIFTGYNTIETTSALRKGDVAIDKSTYQYKFYVDVAAGYSTTKNVVLETWKGQLLDYLEEQPVSVTQDEPSVPVVANAQRRTPRAQRGNNPEIVMVSEGEVFILPPMQTPLAAPVANAAMGGGNVGANNGAVANVGEIIELDDEEAPLASFDDEKPALVSLVDEETPLVDFSETTRMNWWWLLIVAVFGTTTGYAMYKKYSKKEAVVEEKKN